MTAWLLDTGYHDQEMQLADACLVRISELKRDCRVFTLDKSDFQVIGALIGKSSH